MKVAFYAPLKPPDHPVPSGDRKLARLLFAALARAGEARGWEVELASRLRTFDGEGDRLRQARLRVAGERCAERLARVWSAAPASDRPALWFTYHLYHRAPDWLGPLVSERLAIPYVVAEASHAAKQAAGPWHSGHEAATRALRRADAVLAFNRDDVPGVQVVTESPIRLLPPFLGPEDDSGDGAPPTPEERADTARRFGLPPDEPWLLCVAMMRGGRKLASFELLAEACARLDAGERWHLVVAGDGPERAAVETAFARRLPTQRVTFTGRVEESELVHLQAGAELFLWPAVGEPLGMAMLEAQQRGLPVVAARTRGVPDLVRDGETGLLVEEGSPDAFADAVRMLLHSPERRRAMSHAARVRVAREHGFEAAAERIGDLVEGLIRRKEAGESTGAPPPAPARSAVPA